MWGRLINIRVAEPEQPLPATQLAYTERFPRTDRSPLAQAYWTWRDLEEQVAGGPEEDRRVIRDDEGHELKTRESALLERITYLRHMAGVRVNRIGQLQDFIARHWDTVTLPEPMATFVNEFGEVMRIPHSKLLGR
jgi:hypothetical protein